MTVSLLIARKIVAQGQQSFARLIIRMATAAVTLSMAVMLLAVSLVKGFKSEISTKMFGFWGHIHITSAQTASTFEPIPIQYDAALAQNLKNIKQATAEDNAGQRLQSHKGVRHVQKYATKAGIIKTADNFEGIVLKGVDTDFDWQFLNQNLVEGRSLAACPTDTCQDILISKSTADRLKLSVGQKFVVHFIRNNVEEQKRFVIAGIYKTGLEEYDKRFAICRLSDVQALLGWESNQIAGLELFIDDLSDLDIMDAYIHNEWLPNTWRSETVREEQSAIFDWLDLQDVNEKVILGLMLAVSVINMLTALLILILERTNMIGILKAMGSRNWTIQSIFLYYGAYIVGVGLILGNIIGLGLAWLEDKYKFIHLSESDYYLSYAPIKFDWPTIIVLNIGTFAITVVFLVLPTLIVASISPIKAIRFK